jgi:aminopeptidase-like protein
MSIKKFYNLGKNVLYPICRSITGSGQKKTLRIIKNEFPSLNIRKIRSGKKVYDWKVPFEWNIKNAYVIDKFGNKIIDFKKNNLHVMGYSSPVKRAFKKEDLLKKLYSLPNQPKAIPYITSYYKKNWGFCVSHKQKKEIRKKYKKNDIFKVVILSSFNKNGYLNYGELLLKGKTKKEILISTNICHPSMANNELSGPIVSMSLINHFKKKKLDKSIRFLFIPETIGAITFLSKNLNSLKKSVIGGYSLSCIGDERNHSCILSKNSNTQSDKSLIEAYKKLKIKYKIYPFLERGSDERQYNSPGIDLPIALICRSKFQKFPEYHTSLDNFKLVTLKGILGGFNVAKTAIEILQKKIIPINNILCEPQMSKRLLYPSISLKNKKKLSQNFMNFLQYSDGKNDIKDISKILKLNHKSVQFIYNTLKREMLIS